MALWRRLKSADHVCRYNFFGRVDAEIGSHDKPVRCIEWLAQRGLVATGSWDGTLRLWDPRLRQVNLHVIAIHVTHQPSGPSQEQCLWPKLLLMAFGKYSTAAMRTQQDKFSYNGSCVVGCAGPECCWVHCTTRQGLQHGTDRNPADRCNLGSSCSDL